MTATGDSCPEFDSVAEDPLVRRLRGLDWAEVPADVRERCWESISSRISAVQAREARQTVHQRAAGCGERYAFSRLAPAQISSRGGWGRRSARRRAVSLS